MLKPAFAERFETGVSAEALADLTHVSRSLRRDPEPRAEPAGALCRLLRLRDQGRHPRLGDPEGAGDLRARASRRRSAIAAACWSPTRPGARTSSPSWSASASRFDRADPRLDGLLAEIKERESQGYAYEGADASLELLARRRLGKVPELLQRRRFSRERRAALRRERQAEDVRRGGGEGRRERRQAHVGGGGQRPGQRARPRAPQGSRRAQSAGSTTSSWSTTRCAS